MTDIVHCCGEDSRAPRAERKSNLAAESVSHEVIRLWPDGPPTKLAGVGPEIAYRGPVGAVGAIGEATMLRNVSEPTLTVFRPAKPNGVGVIVCPGGGWKILTWEHEGIDVARWLAAHGYTAFLLKYRVRATPVSQADFDAEMADAHAQIDRTRKGKSAYRALSEIVPPETVSGVRAAALEDGRRVVAIVRERAKEWSVDPAKVGIIGFSAGAFSAVDVAIDAAVDPRGAPLAFVAAVYGGETRGRPVPTNAPPLFACVAQDDVELYRVVETLYSDWTDAARSAELHIYRRGGHGFGMLKQSAPFDRWIDQLRDWLTDLGFA
ncbi:MAG TPA: dienelactone hydrolase family protein [Gammaproteobacteria bacterium]|nr:dienelactone hydrolase family protein [Gammaproteobacteria bacterium]